ncbi:MAG: L-aspartate oxidase [Desulfurococcales archaeon ex4484_58]|nr:MAG: L-aspartate oxidase [Desulfurococcales archaeon ex4484_58]
MKIAVIGGGLAGLTTAISLARYGYEVHVYHIGGYSGSSSYRIQAGIAMALSPNDSLELHVYDTLSVGRFLNDVERVWFTLSKASEAYDFLSKLGFSFESIELEAGHSVARTYSVKGATGIYLMEKLYSVAREEGIMFVEKEIASLITSDRVCLGFIDHSGNEYFYDVVVIATGGYTALYKYFTGSPNTLGWLIGDYILHGGTIYDPEFIQFHPTTYVSEKETLLLTEALRGRGARIIDENNERFVDELAPRDIVSRKIYEKLLEGVKVYLDLTVIKDLPERFPRVYEALRKEGIDPLNKPVPITPAAHYSIGGISVDLYYRSEFKNLYVVGEATGSGLHGANRLAGNSGLECIVSGLETAKTIHRDKPRLEKTSSYRTFYEPDYSIGDLGRLRDLMWGLAGIIRDASSLKKLLEEIDSLNIPRQLNILVKAIISCAYTRRESRGVHYRRDYPYMRSEFKRRSRYRIDKCII